MRHAEISIAMAPCQVQSYGEAQLTCVCIGKRSYNRAPQLPQRRSLVSAKAFIVCIDEIRQSFASGEPFVGSYTKTVTMSDGSTRTISLTPMVRDGVELR